MYIYIFICRYIHKYIYMHIHIHQDSAGNERTASEVEGGRVTGYTDSVLGLYRRNACISLHS